jgi:hypothetical protein
MRASTYTFTTFLLFLQFSSLAIAQAPAPTGATAAPASDQTNYVSDKIKFQTNMFVQKVDMTAEAKTLSAACVPAYSTLRGIGTLKIGTETRPAFVVTNVSKSAGCNTGIVNENDVVVLNQADIDSTPPDRYGLTYGALLVPYKYHLGGSKTFTGNTSVGGYVGFRQDRTGVMGIALEYIAFLGASAVPVAQNTNGQSTTQNLSGVSYGLGIIGNVKGAFHMGVVVGADRVNPNAGYVDNGKPWVAVELGYSFSN